MLSGSASPGSVDGIVQGRNGEESQDGPILELGGVNRVPPVDDTFDVLVGSSPVAHPVPCS